MSKKSKEKKKKRSINIKDWASKNKGGFESSTLNIPTGINQFQLKAGKAQRIDIIPYIAGKGNPNCDEGELAIERTYWIHKNIGPDQKWVSCLAKNENKKCPVCEFRVKLQSDSESSEEAIKALAPQKRQLWNVIDVNNRDKGIQIWDVAQWSFGRLLATLINESDEEDEYDDIYEIDKGSSIRLLTEDKGEFGTQVQSIQVKSRTEQYEDNIIDEATCLDDIIKLEEYDDIKKLLLQIDEDEEEESKSKKSTKKKVKEDDDNDDDDNDDDDDDDDDDEKKPKEKVKTKKTTKKSTKKKVKEDDDNDDDDNDDDDNDDDDNDDDDNDDDDNDDDDDDDDDDDE
jgi:hypothetical protein